MKHYVQFKNNTVLLGCGKNLHFATFNQLYKAWKKGELSKCENNIDPKEFFIVKNNYRFRFPFHDENNELGCYPTAAALRGVLIEIENEDFLPEDIFEDVPITLISLHQPNLYGRVLCDNPNRNTNNIRLELYRQQLTITEENTFALCPVLRCPFAGTTFLIKEAKHIKLLAEQVKRHYCSSAPISQTDDIWLKVIDEINQGLTLNL